jgi:phosphatidylserine/phosphatidylglycerophosphate/cardiolipin synthase-like enzyme
VDFKRSPLLLLCIGLIIGIVVAEMIYIVFSPTVLADGSVQIVVDRDYFPEVSSLLSSARESIHVVMFSANYQTSPQYRDGSTNKLLQQLVAAHNRGVDVKIVMDDWPEGNEKAFKYLEENNVKVKLISRDGTVHAKLIIVDGKTVMVGSTNWSHHSLDKNNEANVLINDERVARGFEGYLDAFWPGG